MDQMEFYLSSPFLVKLKSTDERNFNKIYEAGQWFSVVKEDQPKRKPLNKTLPSAKSCKGKAT
jgi:hypothetical protein